MFDLTNHASLLPNYASDHERRVATLGYDIALPAAIQRLRWTTHPLNCHEDELPFLAWEESVDYWQDAWTVEVKHAAIDAAEEIHLFKGTLHAVETALSTLGLEADITEWWQLEVPGQRGTFTVELDAITLYRNGPPATSALQIDVRAWVTTSKPLTRHFAMSLKAGLEHTAHVAIGGTANVGASLSGEAGLELRFDRPAAIAAAATFDSAGTVRGEAVTRLQFETPAHTAAACTIQSNLLLRGAAA